MIFARELLICRLLPPMPSPLYPQSVWGRHSCLPAFSRRLLLTLLALTTAQAANAPAVLDGYWPDSSRIERDWEATFRAIPSADRQREYMLRLTAPPHHVGSPYGNQTAEWLLPQFQAWGFAAQIQT